MQALHKFCAGICFTCLLCFSCESVKGSKKVQLAKLENHCLDSLEIRYKDEFAYSFFDNNAIFKDKDCLDIMDTLPLAKKVFLDSLFWKDGYDTRIYSVTYTEEGKIKHCFVPYSALAQEGIISKKDSNLLFLGNVIPRKSGYQLSIVKTIYKGKLVEELTLDSGYFVDSFFSMAEIDSAVIAHTSQLLNVQTSYSACAGEGTSYFFNIKNNKFQLVVKAYGFGVSETSYRTPNIYLPTVLSGSGNLYMMNGNDIARNDSNNYQLYAVPKDVRFPINELIYVEYLEPKDSLLNNKPVLDKFDEPIQIIYASTKILYRWNGAVLDSIR